MAYDVTTWKNGDVITAEKLNNIENGIEANETAIGNIDVSAASDAYIVTYTKSPSGPVTETTYADLETAAASGKILLVKGADSGKFYQLVKGKFVVNVTAYNAYVADCYEDKIKFAICETAGATQKTWTETPSSITIERGVTCKTADVIDYMFGPVVLANTTYSPTYKITYVCDSEVEIVGSGSGVTSYVITWSNNVTLTIDATDLTANCVWGTAGQS